MAAAAADAPPDQAALDAKYRAKLSQIQAFSEVFNGFTEDELDDLYPFLAIVEFEDEDLIAQEGEEASWVGLLLSGEVAAVKEGKVLGGLTPGKIMGEMALFRGGKRMADLKANGSGVVAALLFSDLPELYEGCPAVAHKLFVALSRAAVHKGFLIQQAPARVASKRAAAELSLDPANKYRAAAEKLEEMGLTPPEVLQFMGYVTMETFIAQQVLMVKNHIVRHFGLVLQGAVDLGGEKGNILTACSLVGEQWMLSGHPVASDVVGGGSGGVLGTLSLDTLRQMAEDDGNASLAIKIFKLLGIAATRTPNNSPVALSGYTAKAVEVLYRRRVNQAQSRAAGLEEEVKKEAHDKARNEILMTKVKRDYEALQAQLASTKEQGKVTARELKKAHKEVEKLAAADKDKEEKTATLEAQLKMVRAGRP